MVEGDKVVIFLNDQHSRKFCEYHLTDGVIKRISNTYGMGGLVYHFSRWDGTEEPYFKEDLILTSQFYGKIDDVKKSEEPPKIPKAISCNHNKKYLNKATMNRSKWFYVCPDCLSSWDYSENK